MILWWHLSNNESSAPESMTKVELVVKIRFIQEGDVLVMCVGWSVSWLDPGADVKDSISCPSVESLSSVHHLENLALKSPANIEQSGFKSLILERH